MYDLRFPHPPSPMKSYTEPTRPVLRYEQHYNEYRINLGFDIDLETGLLAVGASTPQLPSSYSQPFHIRPPKSSPSAPTHIPHLPPSFPTVASMHNQGKKPGRLTTSANDVARNAGREDKQVHLYNLHTASKIHTRLTNRTFDDYPRCMQFSRTARPSRDPPSLLVGEGKNIWRWAW